MTTPHNGTCHTGKPVESSKEHAHQGEGGKGGRGEGGREAADELADDPQQSSTYTSGAMQAQLLLPTNINLLLKVSLRRPVHVIIAVVSFFFVLLRS